MTTQPQPDVTKQIADRVLQWWTFDEDATPPKVIHLLNDAAAEISRLTAALETAQETIRLLMEHNEKLKHIAAVYAVGKDGGK